MECTIELSLVGIHWKAPDGNPKRRSIFAPQEEVERLAIAGLCTRINCLPTLIVATVDKLALLGQNQHFSNLFGRVDLISGVHGASFGKTMRCARLRAPSARGSPKMCAGTGFFFPPFHDPTPAVLVQDELPLLK